MRYLHGGVAGLALLSACASTGGTRPDASTQDATALLEPVAAELVAALGTSRVAVLPFAASAGAEDAGEYLAAKLAARLHAGGADLVERQQLDKVLGELALEQLGVIDEEEAHEAGRVLGVEALVLGRVTVLPNGVDLLTWAVNPETAAVLGMAEATLPRASVAARIDAGATAAQAPPIELSTLIVGEHQTPHGYVVFELTEGESLASGDGFKLVFRVNRPAYVYLIILDSTGKASVLFPSEAIATEHRVDGGVQVEVPPGDQWFFLDENTGTETLYVMASVDPLGDVGALLAQLEAVADAEAKDTRVAAFAGTARATRGVGGIKKGPPATVKASDGAVLHTRQAVLEGTGAVVRALSFEHQ